MRIAGLKLQARAAMQQKQWEHAMQLLDQALELEQPLDMYPRDSMQGLRLSTPQTMGTHTRRCRSCWLRW